MCVEMRASCAPLNSPETTIANLLIVDLGVVVNAQALRIFIRKNWSELARAAHDIHGS